MKSFTGFGCWTFEQVELVNPPILVAALLRREIKAPSLTIGERDERNSRVEGVLERLTNGILSFAGLLDLDKNGGLGWRMAKREISAAFACLEFRPDHGRVPCIPSQFLKHTQDDALRDRLLIGEPTLSESCDDVRKRCF